MASGFVLDEGNNKQQQQTPRSSNPRGNGIADLMSDRNGNPPTQKELEEMQNRLLGRDKNFSKLSQQEKEKIMFEELQNWHFRDMPSIEQMKKEINEHPLTCEVKSFDSKDTKGYKNQHVNLLAENVTLAVVSDGKKINFNNRELLEQYRQAVQKQENKDTAESKDVQSRGQTSHKTRKFDD